MLAVMTSRWLLPLLLLAVGRAELLPRQILHLSDVHLNLSESLDARESAAIPIRYYSDAPVALLESALAFAKQQAPAPDLLLYTGDHAAHGDFSDAFVASAVRTNVQLIEKFFPPGDSAALEATAVVGNADANPDYHMEVTDPSAGPNPSIALIADAWRDSLSKPAFDLFSRRGFLKYAFDDRLEIITLNTVPYSPSHVPDTADAPDPFGQFAWLDDTLAALQALDKFAYITGHIAPIVDSYGGNPQWHENYIDRYKAVVGKYPNVVKAQIFGHVHSIEFRIPVPVLDEDGMGDGFHLIPMFVTGSISPLFGNNPSFMVWDFDAETYDMLDFTVYGSDIADTEPKLAWRELFKATTAYGIESLSENELNSFVARGHRNGTLLEGYNWNMKAQSPNQAPCTTALCRAKTLCTMKWWSTRQEYLTCVDSVVDVMQPEHSEDSGVETPPVEGKTGTSDGSLVSSPSTPEDILASSDVLVAIVTTALATAIAIACVSAIQFILRSRGIAGAGEDRERPYENVL